MRRGTPSRCGKRGSAPEMVPLADRLARRRHRCRTGARLARRPDARLGRSDRTDVDRSDRIARFDRRRGRRFDRRGSFGSGDRVDRSRRVIASADRTGHRVRSFGVRRDRGTRVAMDAAGAGGDERSAT
ncbi:MAG TPA: hypothetical protein DCQ98_19995 [Planctomycetaceae bacterium]|nr:hypothetical protein [Planctomycetaceae bacterium]